MTINCKGLAIAILFVGVLSVPSVASTQEASSKSAQGALEVTSLIGRKLYAQPDDGTIAAARKKLDADPKNPKLVVALSQAQAGRRQYREAVATCTKGLAASPDNVEILIERGHRELGLRRFAAAQKDLQHAATLDPKAIDAYYHFGLAHYFQGQFAAAADSFRKGLALAPNNDSIIDFSNWLYVSLRRAKKPDEAAKVLERITPDLKNTGPHYAFYLRLLHFYQGAIPEDHTLPQKPADPNDVEAELAFDTVTYGVGNWHLYQQDPSDQSAALFKQVVAGNAWNAWGFVGAEVELARMKAAH
ncbi:MAG TPA: tetratricopeptide repeat protein [Candidatus Limnocylindrales bacterium]|nr:tetratricopeptide repeat protein [Candidatus Limnocylindrales bacterium]